MARRIFISVAEDSADVHAAALVREASARFRGCQFYGLTGPRLRALGVTTVYDLASHAAMLAGVFSVVGRAVKAVRAVVRSWDAQPPDLVVLLDSPELHLRLARKAAKRGLPVLYYIAPQTWASRAGRNRRIARDIDALACILPFEEAYFREAGVRATFVGHPLFETLRREEPRDAEVDRLRAGGHPVVVLLPGSRRHVIDAMLPRQLAVVGGLRSEGVAVSCAVSCVSADREDQVRGAVAASGVEAEVVVGDNASLLTAADLVLVASGTATLHVAHYRKPMIVMYDAGALLRLVGGVLRRFVLKTPHLSLVNILAGSRVVPEFMPFVRDVGPVVAVARDLLGDAGWRGLMVGQIDEVVRPLEAGSASGRVCDMMAWLLGDDG